MTRNAVGTVIERLSTHRCTLTRYFVTQCVFSSDSQTRGAARGDCIGQNGRVLEHARTFELTVGTSWSRGAVLELNRSSLPCVN